MVPFSDHLATKIVSVLDYFFSLLCTGLKIQAIVSAVQVMVPFQI
jgi:hypothetical protein